MTLLNKLTQYSIRSAIECDLAAISSLDADSNPHPWGENLIKDALITRQNWIVETWGEQGTMKVSAWLTASVLFDQSELERYRG